MYGLNVFAFDSYRDVLNEHFRLRKKATRRKGVVIFAELAGCTAAHVRNISVGRRKLPLELVDGFVRAMGLAGPEADYFSDLVIAIHGTSEAERSAAIRRVQEARERQGYIPALHRRGRGRRPGPLAPEGDPLAQWLHPILRALWVIPGINHDPEHLARVLESGISAVNIAATLRLFPEVASRARRPETVSSVTIQGESTSAEAMHMTLLGFTEAITSQRAPAFRMDTAVWCLEDPGAADVIELLEEAMDLTARRTDSYVVRATRRKKEGARRVVQIGALFWPLTHPL